MKDSVPLIIDDERHAVFTFAGWIEAASPTVREGVRKDER
jgi:hypothetical protein